MKKACVVGMPVEKSLSPKIFMYLCDKFKKDLDYTRVSSDNFGNFIETYKSSRFIGCNITFPLKEQAASFEAAHVVVSPDVKFLKAANVLKIQDDHFYFYNTDWIGFQNSLSFTPQRVLLIGFGSTTQSVLYALGKMGVTDISIRSRKEPNTHKFKELFPNMLIQTYVTGVYDLIVNTTPANTQLNPDFLKLESQDQALFYDVNYFDSQFLDDKLKRQDGLSMLIYQALETWEIWFEKLSNKRNLHDELYKILRSS